MSIPTKYRITIKNTTGVSLTSGQVTLVGYFWKKVAGVKTPSSSTTVYSLGTTLASGSSNSGSVIDNSTDAYEGFDGVLTTTLGSSGTGNVVAYLETSSDGTNVSDAVTGGRPIGSTRYVSASGTQKVDVNL